jgi:hypothetical protein
MKSGKPQKSPKKPSSALEHFSLEVQAQIKLENPEFDQRQISKSMTERWAEMSTIEKHPYVAAAKSDKKRFDKEMFKIKDVSGIPKQPKKLQGTNHMYQNFYEIDSESDANKHKKRRMSDGDDSWPINKKGVDKKKPGNKISINMTSTEKAKVEQNKGSKQTNDPISVDEPKFYFNPPNSKPAPEATRQPSQPSMVKHGSSSYMNNNMYNPDTQSGSTDPNAFMPKPYMFSPTPFAPNRSPGVSPNMMARFNPFTSNPMDGGYDYSNRSNNTPSVMGQNVNMNVNRNENYSNRPTNQKTNVNYTPQNMMASPAINPFGAYGMSNVSPSGFTPIRTNLQKHSPMFSPANADYVQYFNTSPNINCMSNSSFGYQRTPVSTYGRPIMQMPPKPNVPSQNDQSNPKQKQGNEEDIFALNPFGN